MSDVLLIFKEKEDEDEGEFVVKMSRSHDVI